MPQSLVLPDSIVGRADALSRGFVCWWPNDGPGALHRRAPTSGSRLSTKEVR
jgi:hypothetical protein